MRAILVDWLVDVHKKYKLRAETLFLTVAIIDRFLEKYQTARRQLQLVGVASMLIAAKFEEIFPPQVKEFVFITDNAYTHDEVIHMELAIVQALDFNLCSPTAAHFFERYQHVNRCSEAHRYLAQYILELTLVDYKMIRYAPSHLAAAAVLLSNKLQKREPQWSLACQRQTQLTSQMLRDCMTDMCGSLEAADKSSLQAVRKKFSHQKFHRVAESSFREWAPPPSARENGVGRASVEQDVQGVKASS
jgi:cyclin B